MGIQSGLCTFLVAASAVVACGASPENSVGVRHADAPLPAFVRIELVDAAISLGKADHTQWDGMLRVPADISTAPAMAAPAKDTGPLYLAWLAFLGSTLAVHTAIEKPDVKGHASLDRGSGYAERQHLGIGGRAVQDSFTPTFQPAAVWHRAKLTDRLLLQVELVDQDLVNDDPIGVVTLNAQDLLTALNDAGHVHHFPMGAQSYGQVMFVGVVVVPED